MASDQLQRCKWEGCCSCNVASGDSYCREHKPAFSGMSPPTKERKQLPGGKHTARKSVQQPPTVVGQAQSDAIKSPIRKSSKDLSSMDLLPAKRQRLSGLSNGLGLTRSAGSSLSENGIPQSPKRGMFRQSEERTYMLSAIDDFALRPKKNEAVNESALNDQRQLYQKDRHSSSNQPISTAPKTSQKPNLNGHVYTGSLADSTGSHDPYIFNGTTVEQQKHQKPPDESPGLPCEQIEPLEFTNDQWDRISNPQFASVVQAQQGRPIEQDARNSQTSKKLQQIFPSTPAVTVPMPAKRITIAIKKSKADVLSPDSSPGPVHAGAAGDPKHQQDLIKGRQVLHDDHSAPVDPDVGVSGGDRVPAGNLTKSTVEATLALDARIAPQASPTVEMILPQNTETQPAVQTVEPQPAVISIKQPLSALLGGRKWKDMHPEERRLFWVTQHDPQKLDAEIYGELNRPFRPGDALFRSDHNALPPRPTRCATHFGYVNPRTYSFHQQSEEWYQQKQKEISARSNRKANLGKAIERATQRRRAASKLTRKQKHDRLPRRVRDNPKWLAALEVIEKLGAQKRARLTPEISGMKPSVDSDADIESS
ncbi:hypothetical protein F4861DRAFT_254393 [Xylaria intraflava]|nr:hypothetical protein F4861DRAFT_254393 [Xylaria intraflava]